MGYAQTQGTNRHGIVNVGMIGDSPAHVLQNECKKNGLLIIDVASISEEMKGNPTPDVKDIPQINHSEGKLSAYKGVNPRKSSYEPSEKTDNKKEVIVTQLKTTSQNISEEEGGEATRAFCCCSCTFCAFFESFARTSPECLLCCF